MSTAAAKKTKQMPKGGRKGGTVFPRLSLGDALEYARKLVSKTHTGPQSADVILAGVLGSRTSRGKIRMSGLKQYGLLDGDNKSNYVASELAKKIVAAPADELVPLYRKSMLRPTVFRKLFDTFHGDTVTKSKLKQRVADLQVHPDETTACVELYVAGMVTAKLASVDGEQVTHVASSDVDAPVAIESERGQTDDGDPEDGQQGTADEAVEFASSDGETPESDPERTGSKPTKPVGPLAPRAIFNVNVTLDSSLDIEKLQKQLELLKRFGAI